MGSSTKDWNGHTPTVENWQIQHTDGEPVPGHDYPDQEMATTIANKLSQDWQLPLMVKRTV